MSAPVQTSVTVNGHACRVLAKGNGPKLGFLAGLIGVPKWTPFLDALATRFHVVVPSLPGFPGATGYENMDDIADWIAGTLDLLEGAGLSGADLAGSGPGAMLAAEVAAMSPATVNRLVLMAPFGLFDDATPVPHLWANRAADMLKRLANRQDDLNALLAAPEGASSVEWAIEMARSASAAGRMLWPTCDRGLAKRLHRVKASTLLLWGSDDRVVPPAYLDLFAKRLGGAVETRMLDGIGHLIDIDAPAEAARLIANFLTEKKRATA